MKKDKDTNKGRKGERDLLESLIHPMQRKGVDIDYKKPTFTNEPDDGVDLELKAPHNIGELLERIARNDPVIPPPSKTKIHIRIDNKNYGKKIGKPIAEKFVDDIKKNPNDDEHWLTGGEGLTKQAKSVLDNAPAPTRYFSKKNINTISEFFSESENDVDNET